MANSVVGAIWAIDTAGAATLKAGVTCISSVRWVGGAASGDIAQVTDAAGRVVFRAVANGANYTNEHQFGDGSFRSALDVTNPIVATLGSGILYIEIAR